MPTHKFNNRNPIKLYFKGKKYCTNTIIYKTNQITSNEANIVVVTLI